MRRSRGSWGRAALLTSGLAGYVLLRGHAGFDTALARHGSILAYVICALQFGSYRATPVVLGVQAGRGGGRFDR